MLRVVYDWDRRFRLGGTLKPLIAADPVSMVFFADQFIEWFPLTASDITGRATPYLALGLEEYGTQQVELTWNVQLGVYFGNYLEPLKHQTVRSVLGYYQGWDPRMKYVRFKYSHASFSYFGVMLNI